jgi:hypothetical protein
VKCPGVSAGGDLPEDSVAQSDLSLYDKMEKIVRQDRVVTGSWVHFDRRMILSENHDGIATLACSSKLDFHRNYFL